MQKFFPEAKEIFAGITNAADGKLSDSGRLKTGKLNRKQYKKFRRRRLNLYFLFFKEPFNKIVSLVTSILLNAKTDKHVTIVSIRANSIKYLNLLTSVRRCE